MKSFLNFNQETEFKTGKKLVLFLLVFSVLAVFTLKDVKAQAVYDAKADMNAMRAALSREAQLRNQVSTNAWNRFWTKAEKAIKKAGAVAYQRTLSAALNKIAYDAANYIGTGRKGQNNLYSLKGIGDELTQVGDEAAGQFIESFVNNLNSDVTDIDICSSKLDTCRSKCEEGYKQTIAGTVVGHVDLNATQLTICNASCDKTATSCAAKSQTTADQVTPSFNVCSPSSVMAKVKIGLGLVEQTRPAAPNCTASRMIKDWGDSIQKKLDSLKDPNYLDTFVNIFDPRTNDVGIFVLAQTDLSSKTYEKKYAYNSNFIANKGWLDVRDIAGNIKGVPGEAQAEADVARTSRQQAIGKTTGDILVDSANIFLNQLYFSYVTKLLQTLGEKSSKGNTDSIAAGKGDVDSTTNSATNLKGAITKLFQANFGVRADYDILSQLSICVDSNNPGPTECVIDDQFLQAITEKKTVAEAVKEGYLHSDWQLTKDNLSGSYNLRNISILRKYRILPVGWEEAITRAYANDANQRKATLNDYIACFDPNDQYTSFSKDFNINDQSWCQGLIDPNWVLKAPLNYCGKEGFGAQILSTSITDGTAASTGAAAIPSTISVSRAGDYCADSQTCIKEKADGSCDAYGYCNEERRTWVFGSDSCEPLNNTCQNFTNSDSGASVAYLENTLDYDSCTSENSGCRQYSYNGAYASSTDSVSWNGGQSLFLNKNAQVCDNTDGGCTELMRLKPTWGSNLVMNSNFDNDEIGQTATQPALNDWPLNNARATVVDSASTPGGSGGKALKIETSATGGGVYSNSSVSLLPANFQTISGQSYTLSADLYLASGDNVSLSLGAVGETFSETKTITAKNSWQHVSVTRAAASGYNNADFYISGYSAAGQAIFYFKNLKFEISSWDTGYNAYGKFTVYEKLLPAYLEKSCYVDAVSATKDYSLKNNAPAACSNFARKCNKEEAGCELYSAAADNFAVPGQVVSSDYCSSQCLGYDVYVAKASYFNPAASENLIPSQTTACSADASGCNEFTNLDTLASGGEQKEYYTNLKQCVKPAAATCTTFYSWEGTEGGYQLQSYFLKSANGLPEVTSAETDSSGSALCNAEIYNLPINDSRYNADCREFYNAAGQVSYHLASRTITCSDNCHTYRLSDKNVVKNLTESQCNTSDKHWNLDGTCNVCFNGGIWDTNNNACIYQAIPGEGQTCAANNNGCREYNGNSGNNVRLVTSYDFESGSAAYWTSNCAGGISVSAIANSKNGHSLRYSNAAACATPVGSDTGAPVAKKRLIERILAGDNTAAQLAVGNSVNQGSAYTVKFLASAAANTNLRIYFLNRDTGAASYFNASSTLIVKGGNEWNLYQANLDDLNHVVGPNERLIITADADFLFDDFVLSEITDRYYLIKGSSQIPDICYYDIFDQYQGADYNLGCSQYSDRGGLIHNLRQFSKLCSDSAVGCEQMIDTKNYSSYKSGIWNDANNNNICDPTEVDCVKVAGDSAIYAVYDSNKLCTSASKGCGRFGQGQGGATITSWTDAYRQNNPDIYTQSLCQKANVGCEEWQSGEDNTLSYFKNPGANTCSYRAGTTDKTISGKAWYKIAVKRCDINGDKTIFGTEKDGAICTSDTDCATGKCIIDNNDYPCSVSSDKTIGLGGAGNQVWIPDTAAGLCNANESSCTEYIDPVSQFSVNLVYNAGYQTINDEKEGWGYKGEVFNGQKPTVTQQIVKLESNKLYSFTVKYGNGISGDTSLLFTTVAKPLLADNNFGAAVNNFVISGNANQPIIFNSVNNSSVLISGGAVGKTIEIKELVVDYQLKANIDKTSCNGLVNFDDGCVLFNERSVSGASGLASLEKGWDAYKTVSGATPTACSPSVYGACTANQLIKVRPDRVCSKWLSCLTYYQDPSTKKKTCYSVGECNRLDDKNECANFVVAATSTLSFDMNKDKNATGYSMLDKYHFSQIQQTGIDADKHYDFEENPPALSCSHTINFPAGSGSCTEALPGDLLVREPAGAPVDYPAHGKTYLIVPAASQISPLGSNAKDVIDLESPAPGEYNAYYLNYMVNTHKTGLHSKVIITDANGAVMNDGRTNKPLIFYASADNGWETKVAKFEIANGKNKIKIYLASDTTESDDKRKIYFDNLNIEPVLEIGKDQYATRECRLYPTEDSLDCASKYENVVKNGLEGYCLEHDSFNPNVCLLWYPVDKISSTKLSQISAYAYQGTYPLNYCTAVNGNFDIVEKRVGVRMHNDSGWDAFKTDCKRVYNSSLCPKDYYLVGNGCGGENDCGACLPDPAKLLSNTPRVTRKYDDLFGKSVCEDVTYEEGWGLYNGNVQDPCPPGNECAAFRPGDTTDPTIIGATKIAIDEELNAEPPYRIYEYGKTYTNDKQLKSATGDENLFSLTCNQFTQVVDSFGNNKAWTGRTGNNSSFPEATPNFFVNASNQSYGSSPYNLSEYGHNRTNVPFGSATWPSDYNLTMSDPIFLRNISTDNEDVLAGRPYGCDKGSSINGCISIGYCQNDKNVYCLTSKNIDKNVIVDIFTKIDEYISKNSCGTKGACLPLWAQSLNPSTSNRVPDYSNILKTIFLKSWNGYSYSNGKYIIDDKAKYADYKGSLATSTCNRSAVGASSFCAIFPTVKNVKLYAGDTKTAMVPSNKTYNISDKGIYRLEFNTDVDDEQQPLKSITIDWDDDSNPQVITGEDEHPATTTPHVSSIITVIKDPEK